MLDVQDLLESNRKSNLQKEEDTKRADILIEELKQRLQREKVTPEKQKLAADNVFQALGQGLPWRKRQFYSDDSINAK